MKTGTLWARTPQGRKPVGQLREEAGRLVLVKTVSKSKHLHRALDAWAMDATLIDQLPPDVDAITVCEREEGKTYRVGVRQFADKAILRDFGYGRQYFLPRRYWTMEDDDQQRLFSDAPIRA